MVEDNGEDISFVGDRVSMAWDGGHVSSSEGFSEGDFGGMWRKGEGETIAGESWVMTEVGDGFSVRGQLSTVFFTGVFGSGGKRWQLRLGISLL